MVGLSSLSASLQRTRRSHPDRRTSSCESFLGACGACAFAEVRLEMPEIVEMLARPEQLKCGVDCRLVAAAGGVAHAREQTAAALGVADVRRRHRAVVHERVPERDVPRLECMDL